MASAEPVASTADSLRALRRGLQRSSGQFALFFAVCDQAEVRKELIRLLEESMSGTKLEVVTLTAEIADPLAEILAQVGEGGDPVMVLGLERGVRMGSDDAPVLRALNLGRAEWPDRLRRPVIFWIPEALLGGLGRTAPDFLDWRSDTVHFSNHTREEDGRLVAFDSRLWHGGLDGRMPESDRLTRVDELRSRLRTTPRRGEELLQYSRGAWLVELGNHLSFLGDLFGAEQCYLDALAIAQDLNDERAVGDLFLCLGTIATERGNLEVAELWYRRAHEILERFEESPTLSCVYVGLAGVAQQRGRLSEADEWYKKAIQIDELRDDRRGLAVIYHNLGLLSEERGSLDDAHKWYMKSLRLEESEGNLSGIAASYHQLGIIAQERGSFEEAEQRYLKSLEILEILGHRVGIARAEGQLATVAFSTGRPDEGVRRSVRSFRLYQGLGSREIELSVLVLRRGRQLLGEERFRDLVCEHAETPEIASAVLEATTTPLDEPAEEIAEAATDHQPGRSPDDES